MNRSINFVGSMMLAIVTFVGCAQDNGPVAAKASASSGGSLVSPSPAISGGGVTPSLTPQFTRGSLYGSCLRPFNSQFVATGGDSTSTAPIQGCTQTSEPTCAAGFQLVTDDVVQMNCSTTPSPTNISYCYWKSQKCAKLAGADASESYTTGATYGVCFRKLDNAFQPTYADPFVYPITGCSTSGAPTCAAGFKLVSDVPVQMNCSATPTSTFEPCYFQTQRCMKL